MKFPAITLSTIGSKPFAADAPVASRAITFDEVYARHAAWVWQALRRHGVSSDAIDDATQDVFVVIHRRLGEFEGRSRIETWIYGIVLRVARDHRRRRARKGDGEPLDERLADTAPDPLDSAMRSEATELFARLMNTLDEDKRDLLVMAELEQMPIPAIAEVLGVNLNTLYSRVRTARAAFEHALIEWQASHGEEEK